MRPIKYSFYTNETWWKYICGKIEKYFLNNLNSDTTFGVLREIRHCIAEKYWMKHEKHL